MEDCQCPDCKAEATQTWALVPVCQQHFKEIESETNYYYKKRIAYAARYTYMRIVHLIPWRKKA